MLLFRTKVCQLVQNVTGSFFFKDRKLNDHTCSCFCMKPLEQRVCLSRSLGQIKTAESSDEKLKTRTQNNLTRSVTDALQS